MTSTWALVPLDHLERAKTRLAGELEDHERRTLVRVMARHVLQTIARVRQIERTVLVSSEPEAGNLFAGIDYEVFYTAEKEGLNRELEQAADYATDCGTSSVLIVHADLPFITPSAIRAMLARGGPGRLLAAACKHGTGTNTLLAPTPLVTPLQFGPGSLAAFGDLAKENGLIFDVINDPALAMDIDDGDDYRTFRRAG